MKKVMVSFSSGKDSVLALHRLSQDPDVEIKYLFTTVSDEYNRISSHGVHEDLLDLQAEMLGFNLKKVYIKASTTNDEYERVMKQVMQEAEEDGVTHVMFGDILLEDIKKYRENNLKDHPIKPLFPLWGESTKDLMDEFLQLGYKTIITTIDPKKVPREYLGKVIDYDLLNNLPEDVDICGENGEFHTFVFDGPLFKAPLPIEVGKEIKEDTFYTYQEIKLKG
ncbi:diphthine--ammonia ligase [Bacillaceae bacterium W0354]